MTLEFILEKSVVFSKRVRAGQHQCCVVARVTTEKWCEPLLRAPDLRKGDLADIRSSDTETICSLGSFWASPVSWLLQLQTEFRSLATCLPNQNIVRVNEISLAK